MNFAKLKSIDVEIDRKKFYEELTTEDTFFIFKDQSAEDEFFKLLKNDMWCIVNYYVTERTAKYDFMGLILKNLDDIFWKLNKTEFRGCRMTMDMTYGDYGGDEEHDLLSSWNPNDVISNETDAYELLIGWFLIGGIFLANPFELKYMFNLIKKYDLKEYTNSNIKLMVDTLYKSDKSNVEKLECFRILSDYMVQNSLNPSDYSELVEWKLTVSNKVV